MKIATFNVNSVRARLPILERWLAEEAPDVVAMQETKVADDKFPFDPFRELGYEVAIHGQPRSSGVAILSKAKPDRVMVGYGREDMEDDARLIAAEIDGITIFNSYVPNGTDVKSDRFQYKLEWLRRFRERCDEIDPSKPAIWLGDINVARHSDDVFEPERHLGKIGHHPEEFAALDVALGWGWVDTFRKFTSGPGHHSFWEYRIPNAMDRGLGWRIDTVYASPGLADRCVSCEIQKAPRTWERPSDHTPVVATFG